MKPLPLALFPAAKRLTPHRAALSGAGLLALASLLAATSGCVVTVRPAPEPVVYAAPPPGEVTVDVEPPAPIVETVGIAPGPGFFWIGGYYHWYGNRWGWVAGHYERPPHHGAVWVGPRYEVRGGRRVYVRGFWR
jgi:hypothetical protein